MRILQYMNCIVVKTRARDKITIKYKKKKKNRFACCSDITVANNIYYYISILYLDSTECERIYIYIVFLDNDCNTILCPNIRIIGSYARRDI